MITWRTNVWRKINRIEAPYLKRIENFLKIHGIDDASIESYITDDMDRWYDNLYEISITQGETQLGLIKLDVVETRSKKSGPVVIQINLVRSRLKGLGRLLISSVIDMLGQIGVEHLELEALSAYRDISEFPKLIAYYESFGFVCDQSRQFRPQHFGYEMDLAIPCTMTIDDEIIANMRDYLERSI